MNINLENLSLDEQSELVEDLRKKRFAVALPDSLRVLAVKAIAKNCNEYMDRVENPMRVLPNTLVQDFLKMIKEARYTSERLIPKQLELKFVLLLLNANLTEFDPYEFNPYSRSTYPVYYKHILENCPIITKIVKGRGDLYNEAEEIPLEEIFKWKNIKYIGYQNCICKDEHFEQLLIHTPKLEGIEVAVSKSFTAKGIECLSKMQNLKHLALSLVKEEGEEIDSETIVHCVGKIPNLQTFHFFNEFSGSARSNEFMIHLAKHYPLKKLIVNDLRLSSNFETDWPVNLIVEKLNIEGHLSSCSIEKFCSIPCQIKELTFDSVPYHQVYAIVKKIGHQIRQLHFFDFASAGEVGSVNLVIIIEACPNLEGLSFKTSDKLETVTNLKVPLQNFRKWKEFDIDDPRGGYDDGDNDNVNNQVDYIFKLFLLGKENYNRKIHLKNVTQINMVGEALKENPSCMNDVEKLCIEVYKDGMLEAALDAAKKIIFCSPYLKKIKIKAFILDPELIPQEIRQNYKWFLNLVEAVGIKLKCVCETEMGKDDSSFEEYTELEDSDESGSMESADEEESDLDSVDYEYGYDYEDAESGSDMDFCNDGFGGYLW